MSLAPFYGHNLDKDCLKTTEMQSFGLNLKNNIYDLLARAIWQDVILRVCVVNNSATPIVSSISENLAELETFLCLLKLLNCGNIL